MPFTKGEVFSGDLFGVEDEKANRADTGAVLSAKVFGIDRNAVTHEESRNNGN